MICSTLNQSKLKSTDSFIHCAVTGKMVLEKFSPGTKIFRKVWSMGPEFSRKNSPRDHISMVKWSYHKNFGPIKKNGLLLYEIIVPIQLSHRKLTLG